MHTEDHETAEDLREITEEMHKLVTGVKNPHDYGYRIWETAFRLADNSPDLMWPMMLLWGALTSLYNELKQDEKADRDAAMAQAANEWLALEDNNPSRETYFDHWLYGELGYQRSSE
ncbi:MAG: hypothetical protein U9N80_02990 [Chloroflexota bacterium]|nr:hypothetical protein [Chloroflexota bacterium]